jgi:hypothetical protein
LNTEEQIQGYIDCLEPNKKEGLLNLHLFIKALIPHARLWFLDGKDANGKVVANPNIGYGNLQLKYKDGSSKPFYQVGIAAHSLGYSIYLMGLPDKHYLASTYATKIGNASISSYCIKFKSLKEVDEAVLKQAILDALAITKIS